MVKLALIAALCALSACAARPGHLAKPPAVPALPAALSKRAAPLPAITDPTMRGLALDGASVDMRYGEVGRQLNAVLTIYDCVRVALNEDRSADGCLR